MLPPLPVRVGRAACPSHSWHSADISYSLSTECLEILMTFFYYLKFLQLRTTIKEEKIFSYIFTYAHQKSP